MGLQMERVPSVTYYQIGSQMERIPSATYYQIGSWMERIPSNLFSDGVTDRNTFKCNILSDATRCPLTAMTEEIRLMTASWQAGPNNMICHFTPGTSFVS
jgi:hypothetical protein